MDTGSRVASDSDSEDSRQTTKRGTRKTKTPGVWYRHEIGDQPQVAARALGSGRKESRLLVERIGRPSSFYFVARGSSLHAALYAAYFFRSVGLRAHVTWPSIANVVHPRTDLSDAWLIGVSGSGSTNEVVDAMA